MRSAPLSVSDRAPGLRLPLAGRLSVTLLPKDAQRIGIEVVHAGANPLDESQRPAARRHQIDAFGKEPRCKLLLAQEAQRILRAEFGRRHGIAPQPREEARPAQSSAGAPLSAILRKAGAELLYVRSADMSDEETPEGNE